MSSTGQGPYVVIVLDTTEPDVLAAFWTEALGYERVRRSDEPRVVLVPRTTDRPELVLQRVPEPKAGKNRMHLDLRVRDLAGEVDRLKSLGATVRSGEIIERGWVVMADPEGNEFCVGVEPFDREPTAARDA